MLEQGTWSESGSRRDIPVKLIPMRSVWTTSKRVVVETGWAEAPHGNGLHKSFAVSVWVQPRQEEACSGSQVKGNTIKQGPTGLATESESCPGLLRPCCVTLDWLQLL